VTLFVLIPDNADNSGLLFLPNLFSKLDDHPEFCPLLLFGEDIALFRGSEGALRRKAKLF